MKFSLLIDTGGPDPAAELAIEQLVFDQLRKRIKRRIELMSCHAHGGGATITIVGREGSQWNFNVTACCTDFARRVKWKIEDL